MDVAKADVLGLIPAHAGKTPSTPRCCRGSGAHPRSRGENLRLYGLGAMNEGSSPLTRGKHLRSVRHVPAPGLIPAHAGKTSKDSSTESVQWAHPRSRGENGVSHEIGCGVAGSSPLTRGKRRLGRGWVQHAGLIPAHAGKTQHPQFTAESRGAHPRSRGENKPRPSPSVPLRGSSPLTRGKRPLRDRDRAKGGLIPAHAGKTSAPRSRSGTGGAHPRSRGENAWTAASRSWSMGSSPLTRGKRPTARRVRRRRRLIPAHAGKTIASWPNIFLRAAHPRSRGENNRMSEAEQNRVGSSPLTRGKPASTAVSTGGQGLIPAHAGKTYARVRGTSRDWAHPRSRGENGWPRPPFV